MCWPYHDLRPDSNTYTSEQVSGFLAQCRRRTRWQGMEIPEAEYCGEACMTDADEKMLAEIASAPEEPDPPEDRPPAEEMY